MKHSKHEKKVNLVYVTGNYPTTMQMYFDKYDQKLYDDVYNAYLKKYFNINENETFKYHKHEHDKYYLNFSAFIILGENQKIKEFAFEEFNDLAWIMKVLNIDGLTLSLPVEVYEQIKPELVYHPCFKVEE